MADLKVEVVKIEEVQKHENADRLDIVSVFGYSVVVGREEYKVGDCAVYFPVDAILPAELEDVIFAGTQMKLSKHRVRAARIRQCVSQGLLVSIPMIKAYLFDRKLKYKSERVFWKVGKDLTSDLGVTKHDPEKNKPAKLRGDQAPKREENPLFRKYTKIQHYKRNVGAFEPGQEVIITEKIHGTNFRCGWVPTVARSWIDKLRIKFGKMNCIGSKLFGLPEWTFVYGSHNMQLKPGREGYHGNLYEQCVIANDLPNKIQLGHVWYGEIFGYGVQKGYAYAMKPGEFDVRFFDVQNAVTGQYLDFFGVVDVVVKAGMKVVPYEMASFNKYSIDTALNHPAMKSHFDPSLDAEGIVIRSYNETKWLGGRAILKWISDAYLLKKGMTEFK